MAHFMGLPASRNGLPARSGTSLANDANGVKCCIVALIPCISGTTLYADASLVTAVGTVVKYSGACYTVTATGNCETSLVSGPFTTVSGCDDSSCSSTATPCSLPCADLSTTYGVLGFDSAFPPYSSWAGACPISGDCCSNGMGADLPAWDGTLYADATPCIGSGAWECGESPVGNTSNDNWCITASDGSNLNLLDIGLNCCCNNDTECADGTGWTWVICAAVGATGGGNRAYSFMKTTGNTPVGIYTPVSASGIITSACGRGICGGYLASGNLTVS